MNVSTTLGVWFGTLTMCGVGVLAWEAGIVSLDTVRILFGYMLGCSLTCTILLFTREKRRPSRQEENAWKR